MKIVSIIVPIYNCKKYLSKCLDSIINQTYKRIEVILVDDGSTDGSEHICDQYALEYPVIKVIHQKNSGQGEARNTGVRAATGDYITYVDADDYISMECIEQMVRVIEQYDAEIVEVGNVYMLASKNIFHGCSKNIEVLEKNEQICQRMSQLRNTVWGRLYRKELINGVDFSTRRIGEDCEYSMQILSKCNKLVKYNYCLYAYRSYQESVTRSKISYKMIKNEIDKLYCMCNNENLKNIIEQIVLYCERVIEDIIYKNEQIISFRQIKLLNKVMKDIQMKNVYEDKVKINQITEMIKQAEKESNVSFVKRLYKLARNYYNRCLGILKTKISYEYKI